MLPLSLKEPLKKHLERVKAIQPCATLRDKLRDGSLVERGEMLRKVYPEQHERLRVTQGMLHSYGKLISLRDIVLSDTILPETVTGGDSRDQNVRYTVFVFWFDFPFFSMLWFGEVLG